MAATRSSGVLANWTAKIACCSFCDLGFCAQRGEKPRARAAQVSAAMFRNARFIIAPNFLNFSCARHLLTLKRLRESFLCGGFHLLRRSMARQRRAIVLLGLLALASRIG